MSDHSLGDKSSSESSASEDDGQERSQLTTKPERRKDHRFRAWTFRSDIETDLLSAEGVPVDEKTKLLSEHIRTRISHTQPHAVVCVIAFCNMSKAITRLPHESPSISIPVAWFVQCRKCTSPAVPALPGPLDRARLSRASNECDGPGDGCAHGPQGGGGCVGCA